LPLCYRARAATHTHGAAAEECHIFHLIGLQWLRVSTAMEKLGDGSDIFPIIAKFKLWFSGFFLNNFIKLCGAHLFWLTCQEDNISSHYFL